MNEVLLFTVIACIGILVQSFAGFAGSLTAIPLFSLFLPPREAIPAFNMVMLLVDAWLVFEARRYIQWGRVGRLMVGAVAGIPIGAYGLKYLPTHVLGLIISIVTLIFAILFLLKIRINLKENAGTQMCVGLLSGFLGGSISESGPPVVIYGLARDWDKNAFRTTLLTYFTCLCVLALLCYWQLGLLSGKSLSTFSAAIIPCFLAAIFGLVFKNRVGEATFRRAVLAVIIMVSLIGLIRSLWM
ncbi:MAG: sulfite exporter TauE/SafE family protein [Phycisphaerae bacterium]|nr:sulfite exporter TauE/SafE family protein [Phycisphaerae bacterium]